MEHVAKILEAVMVVSFGISWPISIIKSYKAKTAKGKSIFFLLLILFGYAAGITAKFIIASVEGKLSYVTTFYILNFVIVSMDLGLYFRNRKLDRIADANQKGI